MTLYIMKVNYGSEEHKDYELILKRDKETMSDIYIDDEMSYKEQETTLDEWKDIAIKEVVKSINNEDDIEIDFIEKMLGHGYGNSISYWETYDWVDKDRWGICKGRSSNTWAEWQDVGMTGSATDICTEVEGHYVYSTVLGRIEDIEDMEIPPDDDYDSDLIENALRDFEFGNVEYGFFRDLEDIVPDRKNIGEFTVYIASTDGDMFIDIPDAELTEEMREKIETLIGYYYGDKYYERKGATKKMYEALEKSRTIKEFIGKLEDFADDLE